MVVFFFLSFPLHSLVASAESANERPLPLPHPTPSTPLKCKKKFNKEQKKREERKPRKGRSHGDGGLVGGRQGGGWLGGFEGEQLTAPSASFGPSTSKSSGVATPPSALWTLPSLRRPSRWFRRVPVSSASFLFCFCLFFFVVPTNRKSKKKLSS